MDSISDEELGASAVSQFVENGGEALSPHYDRDGVPEKNASAIQDEVKETNLSSQLDLWFPLLRCVLGRPFGVC